MSTVGNNVGFVAVWPDNGTKEIDGLHNGHGIGVEVGTSENVGAFKYVGDALDICVVGLGVGTKEIDGVNDRRSAGIGVVGVGVLEYIGDYVGMAGVQS